MASAKNSIVCSDNLEFMQGLESGIIDLIYSDILYGTGKDFGDYKDISANKDTIYDFYVPRIKEMYRVLSCTGTILLQMDSRICHWLRCILDDVFTYKNFRASIQVERSTGMNYNYKSLNNVLDTILYYTSSNIYTYNPQYIPLSDAAKARYDKVDVDGSRYVLQNICSSKSYRGALETRTWNGKTYTPSEGLGWDWSQEKIDRAECDGIIMEESSNGNLTYRRYMKDAKKMVNTLWLDYATRNEPDAYKTQKPQNLMRQLVRMFSNEHDTVADFFCGSGSTFVACQHLQRYYVGCDINPDAIKICNQRLDTSRNLFTL